MKSFFGEYYKVVMYTIFGLMIVLSCYTIIINIHHYHSLKDTVSVSELDSNYKIYKNNVTLIEESVDKISDKDIKTSFNNIVAILKKDGVFRLVPNRKLEYHDLYNLNDYFIEELINEIWVSNINKLDISKEYQEEINLLINNSGYMNSYLIKNGLLLYDDRNSQKIIDDYHFILNNYSMFSSIILKISNSLGGNSD